MGSSTEGLALVNKHQKSQKASTTQQHSGHDPKLGSLIPGEAFLFFVMTTQVHLNWHELIMTLQTNVNSFSLIFFSSDRQLADINTAIFLYFTTQSDPYISAAS